MNLITWLRRGLRTASRRAVVALAVASFGMSAGVAAAQAVNNPPRDSISIIVFPQRDFISASGYYADELVMVRVIHDPAVFPGATGGTTDPANWVVPQGDAADAPGTFSGIVEVNHPGGACWFGQTPDIRPGDRVQIEIMAGPRIGRIDETTVANVTSKRPIRVVSGLDTLLVIHGSAQNRFDALPGGTPLPIARLEQRTVTPGHLFDFNGRRELRAAAAPATADGVLSYDPIDALNPDGLKWTATYRGLNEADMTAGLGGEARTVWLGNAVAPAVEATIFEIGALTVAGPGAPCAALLEVLPPPPGSELIPPSTPANLQASLNFTPNTVTLTWAPSTDNVGVTAYGIYRNGFAIFTVLNPDGSTNPPTTFVDRNTPPGSYTFAVRAFDEVGNASGLSNEAGPLVVIHQTDPNTFPFNEPPVLPVSIIAFPSRDFTSNSGYLADDLVTVQIIRRIGLTDIIVSSATGIVPDEASFAEVNHPGGACWEGVTPEMRTGDIVRTIAYNPASITAFNPDGIRTIDQTHIAGVTAFHPVIVQNDNILTPLVNEGIVEVHGTALGANGLPLPLDQIQQRMIATRDHFDFNGRRAMRAGLGLDGTLEYDALNNPMGVKWTSRYTGLNAEDVARMAGGTSLSTGRVFPGADTRIHWLGLNPLLLAEATIFENTDLNRPGPAGPACTRPLEAADVSAPASLGGVSVSQFGPDQVTLSWSPASDDWSVAGYRIFQDGNPIANTGPLATSYMLNTVAPGAHNYDVRAYDTASPRGAGADIITQIAAGFGNLYGNVALASNIVNLTQADVTAPSVPLDLTVLTGDGSATLNWLPCTDDVGVVSYNVYRDALLIATVAAPATTYLDSPLATGAYSYSVDAVDAAAHRSARSAPVTANVTSTADGQAPSIPANVVASTTPDIHGRSIAMSWSAATDNIGVAGYSVYRQGVKIATLNGTALSYTDLNLPSGTYTYKVDAFDSANNHSAQSLGPTAVVANDPPAAGHSVIVFPARDFISASGYSVANGPYHFTIYRGATVINSDTISVKAADAIGVPTNGTGTIDANHPGGTCWLGTTPNIRPGDVVRITDVNGLPDQTTVANVTAGRPIATSASSVVVHGVAKTAAGLPMPIGELQHRFIADIKSAGVFDLNGRRDLRSITDGSLTYDAPGSTNWTATYTGLSNADMLRLCGGVDGAGTPFGAAESRGIWMGRLPLAILELDIYEVGPGVLGGPAGPICAAPAELPAPGASFAPASLLFPNSEGVDTPAQTATFTNNGTSPLTGSIYISGLNPGDFRITSGGGAVTLAPGATRNVNVVFHNLAVGLRQAYVTMDCDAANTTDLSVAITGNGVNATAPPAPGQPTQGLVAGGVLTPVAGTNIGNSTIPVLISWAPSASGLVSSYQLQVSVNSAAWVDVVPQPGIATSVTAVLQMGTATVVKSYQYRVRAMNLAVPSAWSVAGNRFAMKPLDETNSGYISFGGNWSSQTLAGTYGGTQKFATTNKDKSQLSKKDTFTIPGSIAWIATKGPDRGKATVQLDANALVTVDLYAPVQQLAAVVYAVNVGSGVQHQLVVQLLGTRNASSTGTRVDMDALILINGAAGSTPAIALPAGPEPAPAGGPATLEFAPISPNPSVGEAMLAFSTPRDGHVQIGVMDVQGRLIRTLTDGAMPAGAHRLAWDGRDSSGRPAGAGVYFAMLRFDDHSLVRRLIRM